MQDSKITVPLSINDQVVDKVPDEKMNALTRGYRARVLDVDEIVEHVRQGHALNAAQLMMDERGNTRRSNDSFEQAQLIILDIDNSITENGVKRRKTDEEGYLSIDYISTDDFIKEAAFLIYTSPSHTDKWHRFRLLFCLPEPIRDVKLYKTTLKAFIERYGADRACSDPARAFFGNTKAEFWAFGNVVPQRYIDSIVEMHREAPREESRASQVIKGDMDPDHVREMLKYIPAKLEYIDWVKVISGVASKFDLETTVTLIEEWSPGETGEVLYKVRHRLERVGIGTVIHLAKMYGYRPSRGVYADTSLEEEAGILVEGVNYRLTQMGNAERFVDAHKDVVRYCVERGMWLVWDGKRLVADAAGRVSQLAKETFRNIIVEAASVDKSSVRESVLKWAKQSESKACIDASLDLAHRGTEITVLADELDAKPLCINLNNGIFDLATMTLNEHDIGELHTKIIPIDFVEDAECPQWEAFLETIFAGNRDVIDFIQRAVGYTLTGLVSEECLFFCYGSGSNGKSVFFSVLDMLLGGGEGYVTKAKNSLVIQQKADNNNTMDVAELKGSRFVYCEELPGRKSFDESRVKEITSHDKLKARFLYERSFEFHSTFKLWIYGNNKPTIRDKDNGIWRRINLIPFTVTIDESQKVAPEVLMHRFRSEASGILLWALKGFYEWKYNGGLRTPQSIKDATKEYRTEMDTTQAFIDEMVVEKPGSILPQKELYKAYLEWAKDNGFTHTVTSVKLSMELFENKKWGSKQDRKGSREWLGRALASSSESSLF